MAEETREERAARRSREEREAKRRAKGSPTNSPTADRPGSSRSSVSSRAAKRAEEEQEAKRRAKEGGHRSSTRTSSRTSTSTSQSRTSRRAAEDAEAKRRARGGGGRSLERRSTHSKAGNSREREDRESKRRARGGSSRSAATPGAYSAASGSSDRTTRKSERHRHSNANSRSSTRSPRRSDADHVAKRRAREGRRSTPTPGASSARSTSVDPELPPAAAAVANESGTVELQAMAVEAMEDERMKSLEEANQKLQKQMEDMARGVVQRGEAPQNGGNNLAVPAAESEDEDEVEDEGKSNNKKKIIWIVLIVLLLVGIGAGTAIALGGGGSADPITAPGTTAPGPVGGGDKTTKAPVAVTDSPSTNPSSSPTVGGLFEPPKEDDCAAMADRQFVSDQNDLVQRDFTVTLTVVATAEVDLATLESRLQQGIQEVLIPQLAGCEPSVARRNMKAIQNRRNLNLDPFAIGNANADVTCTLAESCADSSTIGTCYDCLTTLGVGLRDDGIKNLDLFGKIGTAFDSDTLIADLGLDDLVGQLNALGVAAGRATEFPSMAPSGMPSFQPSGSPTKNPTGPPTMSPTTSPPTKQPTPGPTEQPTPGPTPGPTPPPTPGPTQPPTPGPTPEPTPPPTSPPTPPPTPPPTSPPTAPPPTNPPVNCPSVQSLFELGQYQTEASHSSSTEYSLDCLEYGIPIYALIIGSDGCHTCAGAMIPDTFAGACMYYNVTTSATWQLENSIAEGETVYYGYSSEFGDSAILPSCMQYPQLTYTGPLDEGGAHF